MVNETDPAKSALEPATVYLLLGHQIILDELKLKLRQRGIKSTKSKLVRAAINLLNEQNIELIAQALEMGTAE